MFSIRNKNAIINFFVSKTNEKTNKNLITLYKLINHALFKTIWDRYAMHYIFYIIISPVNHSLSLTNISKFNFTGLLHLHAIQSYFEKLHKCSYFTRYKSNKRSNIVSVRTSTTRIVCICKHLDWHNYTGIKSVHHHHQPYDSEKCHYLQLVFRDLLKISTKQ